LGWGWGGWVGGLIVAYGYFMEFFRASYSGNNFDVFLVSIAYTPYTHYYSR